MSEYVRLVEVEIVDNVAVIQRFEFEQCIKVRPLRTCCENRMFWGAFAYRSDYLLLDRRPGFFLPAQHRLVHRFQYHPIGIELAQMPRERRPEIAEGLRKGLIPTQRPGVIAASFLLGNAVQINNDCQFMREDFFYPAIQKRQICLIQEVRLILYNTPQKLDQGLRWIRCLNGKSIQETNDGEQA